MGWLSHNWQIEASYNLEVQLGICTGCPHSMVAAFQEQALQETGRNYQLHKP